MDAAEPPRIVFESATPPAQPSPGPAGGVDICQVIPDAPACQAQMEVNLAQESKKRVIGEQSVYPRLAALELGVGPFLMVGGAAGAYSGVTPFVVDEVAQGVYLRPSIAVGQSLATNVRSTWVVARVDTCARWPGHDVNSEGLELDLCGGPDVGFSYVASGTGPGSPSAGKTVPYVNVGPSVDLHGEVGRIAVSLRGVVGINVARGGYLDVTGTRVEAPLVAWRLELDFSWALRR